MTDDDQTRRRALYRQVWGHDPAVELTADDEAWLSERIAWEEAIEEREWREATK